MGKPAIRTPLRIGERVQYQVLMPRWPSNELRWQSSSGELGVVREVSCGLCRIEFGDEGDGWFDAATGMMVDSLSSGNEARVERWASILRDIRRTTAKSRALEVHQ